VLFMPTPDRFHRLRDIELFANCSGREFRRLDSMATESTIAAGHVLCQEGVVGRECYVILDGRVEVVVNGRRRTLDRGALIGEIALLTPSGRRTATATALTDLTVLVFTRTDFGLIMTGIPAAAHSILREATRRLVENSDAL
jgi:CRP-like cAMP-binding protein